MTRTTVYLPEDVKLLAERYDVNMSQMLRQGILAMVEQREQEIQAALAEQFASLASDPYVED